ncbi:MAG: DUF4007 family protein [Clostridiales bacterium]|nr:DUF4007 family protein [Clostridiales bacterium]
MKFRGHDTFYLRQGWLTKGLKSIDKDPHLFFEDKKIQTDYLGIGSVMTKALRYWIEAFELAETEHIDGSKRHIFTDFGKVLWRSDRYLQEENTLWLLHYKLATSVERATAWYWLFNEFDVSEFTEDEFFRNIDFYSKKEAKVAEISLRGDFKCIIKTYLSKPEEFESNMFSPLSELNLIQQSSRTKNAFSINKKPLPVSSEIVFYTLLDQYYKSDYQNKSKEINIERFNSDKNNLAKIYRLNWNSINEHLDNLSKQGLIRVIRTAGLDVVNILYTGTPIDYLTAVYNENEGK